MYAVIFQIIVATGNVHGATITGPMTADECHMFVTAPAVDMDPKYHHAGACETQQQAVDAMQQNLCGRTGNVWRMHEALAGATTTDWVCE